jgi:hypothetical protein
LLAITAQVPVAMKVIVSEDPDPEIEQTVPAPTKIERLAGSPLEAVAVTAWVSPGSGLVGTLDVIVVV